MPDTLHELIGHFIETARAHHEATGGINPQWAEWYASRLIEPVRQLVDEGMEVDDLARWLEGADRRHRDEEPEESWPKAYAGWLLEKDD